MTDFPCEHVIFKPVHPAKIADSELVHHEFARHRVESIRQTVFQRDNMPYWEKSGKTPPFAQWYREATKYRDPRDGRPYVEWKTNAEFRDDRIFFKTLDTGRILPMHLANFRVHFFTTKWYWEQFDQNRKREGTLFTELASLLPYILVFRNFHDYGGADVPIIMVNWSSDVLSAALDYWVELSKGEWSDKQRDEKYNVLAHRFPRTSHPCVNQADLLVRALFSDPKTEYVPPFIIFHQIDVQAGRNQERKACALFTHPSHCPPSVLTDTLPNTCGSVGCDDTTCGPWNHSLSRSLHPDSPLVRKMDFKPPRVVCNTWGCEIGDETFEKVTQSKKLQRCQRCKVVVYCSQIHQRLDWPVHKLVCEGKV